MIVSRVRLWAFRTTVALALLVCFAPHARSQNTAALPWWTSPVVQDLGLSQDQVKRIHQIVRAYRERLFDARNSVAKNEAELEDLLGDSQVSLNAAKPTIDRLADARGMVSRLFTSMSVELRAVLTQDQWRELVKRWAEVQKTKKGRDTQVPPA